jgi:hypothetical protein
VRLEFAIKHSVSRGRSRFWSLANRLRFGLSDRFLGGRGSGSFPVGQRFFAGLERSLLRGEALLLILEPFGGQTLLHLPLHFDSLFFLGLLLLAGNEKRQGSDERQNGKLLHGVIRQGWFLVIRTKTACRPYGRR